MVKIENHDNRCFLHSVACHFVGSQNNFTSNPSVYNRFIEDSLNYSEQDSPMDIINIQCFEERNKKHKIMVNVFFLDHQFGVFTAYTSKMPYSLKSANIINLLFTHTEKGGHYFYIKNINHFFRKLIVRRKILILNNFIVEDVFHIFHHQNYY